MPAQVIPDQKNIPLMFSPTNDSSAMRRLEGQIAIVTGGARGIGEATVRLFARHGAKVVIADVEDVVGQALAASLAPPFAVRYVHCDVSLEEDVEKLIDSTVSGFGRLDIIFNNAGVLGSPAKNKKSIVDFDADEFDRIMRVNFRGVALGMKHAARVMIPRGTGCIISTASVASVMGGLGPHSYTASKHAIVGLTKNAACELGKYGIRVNCISPFGVATPMLINAWRNGHDHYEQEGEEEEEAADAAAVINSTKSNMGSVSSASVPREVVEKVEEFVRGLANLKGAMLRTSDIAEAALYLASDESRYVSGHNLVVDGGITTSRNCIDL